MPKTKTKAPLVFTAGLFMLIILTSMAAAAPALPHRFSGTAVINGRDVPSGSVITAEVQGVIRGSVTLSVDGSFGEEFNADKLNVINAPTGGEISFYVQTPQMSNRIKAAETAFFRPSDSDVIDLTFTGDEIPKSSDSGDTGSSGGGGSGGSGGSSGSGTGTVDNPEVPVPELFQGIMINVDLTENASQDVEARDKDSLNIILPDSSYTLLLKSMSDFSVLFEQDDETFVVGLDETREVDLNKDFVTDVELSLTGIEDGSASLTLTRLDKSAVVAGTEGFTGMIIANPVSFAIIFIIIVGLGGVALKFRRRGSK